jgi:hypothetical protein
MGAVKVNTLLFRMLVGLLVSPAGYDPVSVELKLKPVIVIVLPTTPLDCDSVILGTSTMNEVELESP